MFLAACVVSCRTFWGKVRTSWLSKCTCKKFHFNGFLAGCATSKTFLTHVCTCFCCRETCPLHPRPPMWNMWTDVKIMIVMIISAEFSSAKLQIHLWKKASGSVEASWCEDTASSCSHTPTHTQLVSDSFRWGILSVICNDSWEGLRIWQRGRGPSECAPWGQD